MRTRRSSAIVALLVVLALGAVVLGGIALPARGAAAPTPVSGSVKGPTLLPTNTNASYTIYGAGGPAISAKNTFVGNLSYSVRLSANDLTGLSVTPSRAALGPLILGPGANGTTILTVGSVPEVVTMTVEISSVYFNQNESINLTYTITIVQPYVLVAHIVNVASTTVISFPVTIDLDGQPIGTVRVANMTPGSSFNLTYRYPTTGLSPGTHTFTISLENEHGLVRFAGGAVSFSQSFYVTGPPPNYSLWYAAGVVAFVGVLFIFASRVAARRRGAVRR